MGATDYEHEAVEKAVESLREARAALHEANDCLANPEKGGEMHMYQDAQGATKTLKEETSEVIKWLQWQDSTGSEPRPPGDISHLVKRPNEDD